MLRPSFLGVIGLVLLCSLQGKVASQSPYPAHSIHSSENTAGINDTVESEFVPDTLAIEDDDAEEEEPAEKSIQGKNGAARHVTSSKDKSNISTPPHGQKERVKISINGHSRLLKGTGEAVDETNMTAVRINKQPVPQTTKRQGDIPPRSHWPFISSSLAPPNDGNGASARNGRQTSQASEDEKLRLTTRKLVKWLRNRLQKRLEEVASLEEKCDIEKKLLTHLNETIEAKALERQAEIKMKLETQNELKDVRRHFVEPDRELREVRDENSHLIDELNRLKKTYNDLAVTRKEVENKLVSAGFTHWLDKRGKEYMPATAVGVLSKSARILDPVSRGLEEVVKLDELFSSGVERVIPVSERSLISKIMRDLALLLPVIPVIILLWRISHISRRLSILHLIMYISAIFAIESGLLLGLSFCIGAEAIKELQKSYELFVVTGVFVDVLLFIVMIVMQTMVMALRRLKTEVIQSLLSLAVGYHFFRTVFQPIVVSQPPTTTTAAHSMYTINFILMVFEKKAVLKVGTRFDKHLNSCLLAMERWLCETWQAMKDLFADTLPDMSESDTASIESNSFSTHNDPQRESEPFDDRTSHRKESDVEEATKALNASKDYAKWTDQHGSQGRPTFRGIRWYQTNPQSALLESGSRRRGKQEHIRSKENRDEMFSSRRE